MSDKEYICTTCSRTYAEDEAFYCEVCNTAICKKCGARCVTIKEYDEAMKANDS